MNLSGAWFVAGAVMLDAAALNKEEMLPWEKWSVGRDLAPGRGSAGGGRAPIRSRRCSRVLLTQRVRPPSRERVAARHAERAELRGRPSVEVAVVPSDVAEEDSRARASRVWSPHAVTSQPQRHLPRTVPSARRRSDRPCTEI
jgi:hypothetical protein